MGRRGFDGIHVVFVNELVNVSGMKGVLGPSIFIFITSKSNFDNLINNIREEERTKEGYVPVISIDKKFRNVIRMVKVRIWDKETRDDVGFRVRDPRITLDIDFFTITDCPGHEEIDLITTQVNAYPCSGRIIF
ncbi:hypothetical protein LIER_21581 [Lithospermum erythrorhizon]|uniref:Uncharacterized protein n=1 Tax=Lithospermum erythrorhizon TaxID=34254 RepID=A0AAV3QT79_LITER